MAGWGIQLKVHLSLQLFTLLRDKEAKWQVIESKLTMAGNSRPSFQKRQKEKARQEKAAEKAQKRLQKKQQRESGEAPDAPDAPETVELDEFGQPAGLDFHDF